MIAQARKRVAAAKECWSAVAGGELHRLPALAEQFALVGDSLQKLYPAGETLGAGRWPPSAAHTVQPAARAGARAGDGSRHRVLYLDASLEDADFDHPEQAERVQRLAQRIDERARRARRPEPLEAWMEELYRRVSDRQTMGSVVQELRASLSEIEKAHRPVLPQPGAARAADPGAGASCRRCAACCRCSAWTRPRRPWCACATTSTRWSPPRPTAGADSRGAFDRLADNLGALSFLIDMLSVQPQMAKSLFALRRGERPAARR